jgi:hypothetical protein
MKTAASGPPFFVVVPSMIDSLEVEVHLGATGATLPPFSERTPQLEAAYPCRLGMDNHYKYALDSDMPGTA